MIVQQDGALIDGIYLWAGDWVVTDPATGVTEVIPPWQVEGACWDCIGTGIGDPHSDGPCPVCGGNGVAHAEPF